MKIWPEFSTKDYKSIDPGTLLYSTPKSILGIKTKPFPGSNTEYVLLIDSNSDHVGDKFVLVSAPHWGVRNPIPILGAEISLEMRFEHWPNLGADSLRPGDIIIGEDGCYLGASRLGSGFRTLEAVRIEDGKFSEGGFPNDSPIFRKWQISVIEGDRRIPVFSHDVVANGAV